MSWVRLITTVEADSPPFAGGCTRALNGRIHDLTITGLTIPGIKLVQESTALVRAMQPIRCFSTRLRPYLSDILKAGVAD